MSKARGGLVLKSFLEGGMSKEEMEAIVGEEGVRLMGRKLKEAGLTDYLEEIKTRRRKV